MILKPFTNYFHTVVAIVVISHATIGIICAQQSSLSAQCLSDTEELAGNEAVTSIVPSAECTINLDVSNSCTTDFEPISGDFKDACVGAGGRFYTTDVKYDCTTFAFGTKYDADYTYLAFPACVGSTCTDAELEEYYTNNVHPFMEESFALKGLACEVSDSNELSFGNENKDTTTSDGIFISLSKTAMTSLLFATAIIAL